MKKLLLSLFLAFILNTQNACTKEKSKNNAISQGQEQNIEDLLVDVSNIEDLIASGKIKPAPEFIEINGKMVRTSPEEYKSKDGCGKAEELFWYRKKLYKNYHKEDKLHINYQYDTKKPGTFFQHFLMRDIDGTIRMIGCFTDSCIQRNRVDEFEYVLLKTQNFFPEFSGRIVKISEYQDYKSFSESKYLFLKEKNCTVIFYKGKKF